jgi:hypothetical protein
MPISNRTDKKTLDKTLAYQEAGLKKGSDGIDTAQKSANFSAEDQQVLAKAQDVLLNKRLETEFPIVQRVLLDAQQRLQNGEKLEWTPDQTKGFLSILEDLSFTENDALHKLSDLGVIPKDQWDAFVKPAQDQTNQVQATIGRKAKWMLASMGVSVPQMGIAYGAIIAVGGPAGALTALLLSTGYGLTVASKMQKAIGEKGFVENAMLGVNAAQGKEVSSEPMLLTARLAENDLLTSKEGTLADRMKQEVAMGDMLVGARQSSEMGITPIEQPFIDIAADYLAGLGPIEQKLEKGSITETEARKEIMDLRGKCLDSSRLDSVAKVALSTYVNHPEGQRLLFVRQLAETSQNLVDELKKSGGIPSDGMRQDAAAMLQVYSMTKGDVGKVDMASLGLLAQVMGKQPLNETQIGLLQANVATPARTLADQLEPQLKLSPDTAIKQAKLAFDVLWGTVVPSFNEIKDQPVAKGIQTKALPDGGYEVSGKFKGGILSFLGIGSEGNFSVKLNDAGQVDPQSMKIDLGPKFAKFAGAKALETWSRDTGLNKSVSGVDVASSDGKYVVTGDVGSMRGRVEVSPMGMVSWDTLKVT